ncbi:ATP-NAD kinase family protein [Acidilobus sp.]|jgi:predicted polyphosphate/ATP-dependent NAD kinase|uniref:ATP-NAD kinase family protein n=1 Tax=Acidilobus sp. TaxID=1872109 RepID=UPI003D04EE90
MKGRVGLIVNPIAGMGGRVGLKGTDGDAYLKALSLGSKPVAPSRAREFLRSLPHGVELVTPNGIMGEEEAAEEGLRPAVVRCAREGGLTSAEDTRRCASMMMSQVDLIVFVGGDGTARDIVSAVDCRVPILGVPSGVKMYSGVFAETPAAAAEALRKFLSGEAELVRAEVLDIDEEAFRRGELMVRLYGYAMVPRTPEVVLEGKDSSRHDVEELKSIAKYVVENMEPGTLYLLGPGTSVAAIAEELGVPKTLLGVDAVYDGKVVGLDLNEAQILDLLRTYRKAKVVLSPLGGQGFLLGRGNQQLSPQVIRAVGVDNIIIISTKDKISRLKVLRVDTGDEELNRQLRGYRRVIVGYGEEAVIRVE